MQETPRRQLLRRVRAAAVRLKARWGRAAMLTLCVIALPPVALGGLLAYHIYLDRSHVPNLDAFIRFDLPRIGEVRDAQGHVLIEMAHEYRRVISYDEVPLILREAILATEDKNFFSHGGIEYRSLPLGSSKDRRIHSGGLAEGRAGLSGAFPPRRLDADAATRSRLLPPRRDQP